MSGEEAQTTRREKDDAAGARMTAAFVTAGLALVAVAILVGTVALIVWPS